MATAADEVIADAATVTGSIGVFVLLPTAEQALDKLGVHTGGAPTTWLGAAYDPRRPLDPRFAALVQSSVDHTYADFVAKVAAARRRTAAQIEAVAQGRVWTGAQAQERGLVDRLGRYGDALQAAAMRARLDGAERGDFRVSYLDREPGRLQRLLDFFGVGLPDGLAGGIADALALPLAGWPAALVSAWPQDLQWLAGLTPQHAPFALAAHCLCGEP
jgi:protease-4